MTDHDLTALRKAVARDKEAKTERNRQIIAALQRGVPQVLVCKETGLTREMIRRIALPTKKQP